MSFQIYKRKAPGVYVPSTLAPFDSFKLAAQHVCNKVKPANRTKYVIRRAQVQA